MTEHLPPDKKSGTRSQTNDQVTPYDTGVSALLPKTPTSILAMQRTVGNQATQRLLAQPPTAQPQIQRTTQFRRGKNILDSSPHSLPIRIIDSLKIIAQKYPHAYSKLPRSGDRIDYLIISDFVAHALNVDYGEFDLYDVDSVYDLAKLINTFGGNALLSHNLEPLDNMGKRYKDVRFPDLILNIELDVARPMEKLERKYFQVEGSQTILVYERGKCILHETNDAVLPEKVAEAIEKRFITRLPKPKTGKQQEQAYEGEPGAAEREAEDEDEIAAKDPPGIDLSSLLTQGPGGSEDDFGLRIKKSAFVDQAVSYWRGNKGNTLEQYVQALYHQCNTLLTHPCTGIRCIVGKDPNEIGNFQPQLWIFEFNLKGRGLEGIKTVGDLSSDQAAEIADTVYHELRHCEQYFTVATQMVTEGERDPRMIEYQAGINLETAKSAIEAVASGKIEKLNENQNAIVKGWGHFFGGGTLVGYKTDVNKGLPVVSKLLDVVCHALQTDRSHLPAALSNPDLNPKVIHGKIQQLKSLAESYRLHFDDLNQELDPNLRPLVSPYLENLAEISDEWGDARYDHYRGDEEDSMKNFILATLKFEGALEAAYSNFPHEEDAIGLGKEVGRDFRASAS